MSKDMKIQWWLLTYYLATVVSACFASFVNPLFWLVTAYILVHYFLGPLDWYVVFKGVEIAKKALRRKR